MSKTAKPNEPQAEQHRDIHERIAAESAQTDPALERPAVDALMAKAIEAIQGGIKPHFVYEGRTYWVKLSVMMGILEVFAAPAAHRPLSAAMLGRVEVFGHEPGH